MTPQTILHILLTVLTSAVSLRVTTRPSLLPALRGDDVIIPCQISGLNLGRAIAVLWKMRSEDGSVRHVYEYNAGNVTAVRDGPYVDAEQIRNGDAALRIPRVQFSDEGQYTCTVINTPDKDEDSATLEVSAPPQAEVTPADPTVELGTEKTVTCEVHGFYPKDISIRWGQYRPGSSDCELLEIWTCVKKQLQNSDGTYNVTSLLTLNPTMEDNRNRYSCIISHRSLRTEISRNLTLTVTEREDKSGNVITAVALTIAFVAFVAILGFLYVRFMKKDPPTLSGITGSDQMIDMNRTILTCQIMDFRPNDVTISVCMRRLGEEMKTLYSWRTGGCDVDVERPLMNGSAGHEERPLQLDLVPRLMKKQLGMFSCLCSLHITPSYEQDNQAELSLHVRHPALTSPASVSTTLHVIGVPPKLLSIMSPERVTHEEQLTLTCPISGFKPRGLTITWLKKDANQRETQLVTWTSGIQSAASERHAHHIQENENDDKSHSFISALTMKASVAEDDGDVYVCKVFHPATKHTAKEEMAMRVTAVPVLDSIVKDMLCVGEELDLSCRVHSFYPSNIQVTWYREDGVILPSGSTEPLEEHGGLYHVTSTLRYTPTMADLGKEFRCQVQHESLPKPKLAIWRPKEFVSPPVVGDIQCDPPQPRPGTPVTFSCTMRDLYPGDPTIQWYVGFTKYEESFRHFHQDPQSGLFSVTTELTLTPKSKAGERIRLEIFHSAKTFTKEFLLHHKGLPVLGEISSLPSIGDYGRPVTLRCDVTGCNPGDISGVTWLAEGKAMEGDKKEVRGAEDVLSCYLSITPTAQDYGRLYICRVTCKDTTIEKKKILKLPGRSPTLSDIVVRSASVTANQKASFQVTISGFAPRGLQIKWYKEFSTFPQNDVTILDPEVGEEGLYTSSSTLTFTPMAGDDGASIRCEVTHTSTKTVREKQYTLQLSGGSGRRQEEQKPGPQFHIRGIRCVTERPRVGEEVTLVADIEGCRVDMAAFSWYKGMFCLDGIIENKQEGSGCASTLTFTPETSDTDCTIKLEVTYNYQTAEESYKLRLA